MSATLIHASETQLQVKNLIDGQWVAADRTFQSLNPANRKHVVAEAPLSGRDQVDAAVAAARRAYMTWREWSWVKRAELLDNFAQLVKRDTEALGRLVTIECGKPINEGRAEVVEGLHTAQYVAGLGRLPIGHVLSSEIPAKDAYIIRKPKGVVGIITPWNFPFAVPLWGSLPALLAGNTVVLKPSEETPGVGMRLAELFHEAGFPAGVVNVVHGTGEETGAALTGNEQVDVIVFTGSRQVGALIKRTAVAGETHRFVATELGGKNAVMVLDDADLELAVNACVLSAFKTSGQRCVSSNRLIVDRKILDAFTERFLEKVRRIKVGDGLHEDTFMGPLINHAGVEKWRLHNQKAVEEGGEVLLQGAEDLSQGNFVEPFVYRFRDYTENTFCLREEAFSPHAAIIGCDGVEDAVRIYNDTDYGLSMACITEDYRKWRWVRDHAEYGLGYINLPSIGAEVHLPFGGVKASGNGHPAAETALEYLTNRVAFTVNHGREIVMAQGLTT